MNRPSVVIDLKTMNNPQAEAAVPRWLPETSPEVLNVAGPRRSEAPQVGEPARPFLETVPGRS